jgi:hypothetical protein
VDVSSRWLVTPRTARPWTRASGTLVVRTARGCHVLWHWSGRVNGCDGRPALRRSCGT